MERAVRYHTDLDVWKVSRALAKSAYGIAAAFPLIERFALADQVRRAAVSVPANIAEGCGRGTRQELVRSLRIARGSLSELHSHLSLALDLGYISSTDAVFSELQRTHLLINRMIGSLQRMS